MRNLTKRGVRCVPILLACVALPAALAAEENARPASAAEAPISARRTVCREDPPATSSCPKKAAPAPSEAMAAPTGMAPGESGLVVVRDEATGELRAPETGDEIGSLFFAIPEDNQSDEGLFEVAHPRGGYWKHLQGRFQEYYVLVPGEDGVWKPVCVHDPAAAGLASSPTVPVVFSAGEDR